MRKLRVTCFIDSLGSGGAQRQLCTLAIMLKRRGAEVSMLTYHENNFFSSLLKQEGISYTCLSGTSKIKRVIKVRNKLRNGNQDVVLAFLPGACFYAELAALPKRKWGLIVSERSARLGSHLSKFPWQRFFHRIADYTSTNSHTNRLMIEQSVPQLKGRVVTIYNTVDLETFSPFHKNTIDNNNVGEPFKLVVAASHQMNKNLEGLIKAMSIIRKQYPEVNVEINWYGDVHPDSKPYEEGLKLIREKSLTRHVILNPASKSISDIYKNADAVILPSFYEGLPNVICEAMASGRPVLMSNVCDAGNIVKHGINGFVFNPDSPEDIASAIVRFCSLTLAERVEMGIKSREMAERMFDPETIADRYLQILEAAAVSKKIAINNWVPEIPESAYYTVGLNPIHNLNDIESA